MIVRCERCETRFKLDESRLPSRGARVRCSRCKHAFFVAPPGATNEELVHRVAEESVQAERTRPPEAAWDLEEKADPARAGATSRAQGPGSSVEPGEDGGWRFEDELPDLDSDADPRSRGDARARAVGAGEHALKGLGDPESWDLLSTRARAAADPVPAAPASKGASETALAPVEAPCAGSEAPLRTDEAPTAQPMPITRAVAVAQRATEGPATIVGWIAVIALSGFVAWVSLRPPAAAPVAFAPVGGFEVVEARARVVENLPAGTILVVSGRLRNPGPGDRALGAPLAVVLLDADGAPVEGGRALAGPALGTKRVREGDPEELRELQQRTAAALGARTFAARAEVAFEAVFPDPPARATRFALSADEREPGAAPRVR